MRRSENSVWHLSLLITILLVGIPVTAVAQANPNAVAVLYVYPQGVDASLLYTKTELETHFRGPIKNFWNELSYGKYAPQVTVFTWEMPITSADTTAKNGHYVVDMMNKMLPNGGDFVIPGYDPTQYSKTIILLGGEFIGFGGGMGSSDLKVNGTSYPGVRVGSFTYHNSGSQYFSPALRFEYYQPGQAYRGKANGEEIGYPSLGLTGGDSTLLHEWGHGLGLSSHANYWRSESEPLYGQIYWWRKKDSFWDQFGDYGNRFDTMGGGPKYSLHFNAFYKDLLGWFDANEKQVLDSGQSDVSLKPLESQEKGVVKAVQLTVTADCPFTRPAPFDNSLDYAYYIEYRRPMGFDIHLGHEYMRSNTEGLMVTMSRRKGDGFVASWLLDMSPDNFVYDKSPTLVVLGKTDPNGTYCCYNDDDHHEATLNAGKTFYDNDTCYALTNIRPNGDQGITFDVEKGKKAGVTSGIYTTALFSDQSISRSDTEPFYSLNLEYYLQIQGDGNVVIRRTNDKSFVAGSTDMGLPLDPTADKLTMKDGNLTLSGGGTDLWSSGTGGNPGSRLIITNEGKLVVLNSKGEVIWPKPPKPPSSNSHGDVHMRTPDGLVYDFQAAGEFLFLISSDRTAVVQTRQELWERNPKVSINTAVAMNVDGDRIGVYARPSSSLYVNDEATELASGSLSLSNGGRLSQVGTDARPKYLVEWPSGFVASVTLYPATRHLDVGVAKPIGTQVTYEGLVGNLDGDPKNDMQVRDGDVLSQPAGFPELNRFGDSWRISADESLFRYEDGTSTATYNPQAPPRVAALESSDLPHLARARNTCATQGVTDATLLAGCITDVGATGEDTFGESAKEVQTAAAAEPPKPVVVEAIPGQYARGTLIGQWVFVGREASLEDRSGHWSDIELQGATFDSNGLHLTQSGWARAEGYAGAEIGEKTLVASLIINDLTNAQPAGAPLSIDAQTTDRFDGIVFGEQRPNAWMAGSSYLRRSQTTDANPKTTATGEIVKIAITYKRTPGNQAMIVIYKNGERTASYTKGMLATWREGDVELLFGPRHTLGSTPRGFLNATILAAEIHNVALTREQIAAAANPPVEAAATEPAATEPVVALRSAHGRYLATGADHSASANGQSIGAAEKWTMIDHGDGTVSFKSQHGRYLVAEGDHTVSANRVAIGPWEKWARIDNADGTISFKSAHGRYLVAESNHTVGANRVNLGAWEKWTVLPQ